MCIGGVGFRAGSEVKNPYAAQETQSHPQVRRTPWRREWQLPPVLLPGEFHAQRSLLGYSPWGCKKLDMTDFHTPNIYIYISLHI